MKLVGIMSLVLGLAIIRLYDVLQRLLKPVPFCSISLIIFIDTRN